MELFKSTIFLCLSLMMSDASIKFEDRIQACNSTELGMELTKNLEKIDHFDLYALVIVESRWDKNAVSSSGACGLTQVLPKYSNHSCEDLFDPNISLREGSKHLDYWISKSGGDKRYALCGYAWGYSCILARKRKEYHPGLAYADRVMSISKRLKARYENYEKHFNLFIYNIINKIKIIQTKSVK